MNLRPLGYENREAPFNLQQHPMRTARMYRHLSPDQAGATRCRPGLFDGG
jgi:hypothetical protein